MNNRLFTPESPPQNWDALKIAGLYLLIGGLWILFSDKLALMLSRDSAMLSRISIFKGWVYIGVTALLLYWLIRRHTTGLSQSEARYRSLFQNNHSVMLLIDPHSGAIVDANPAACAFYGYSYPEITGLKITAINQLNREQVFVEMERAVQEERRQFFFRHRLAGGDIREVEVYSSPIEVQGKELLYSIVHDISARKQAETRLHEMIENMAVAQSIAHFGSWEIELTGEPQRFGRQVWSDESYRIFGYEPGTLEIDFEFFVKHLHPDDREAVLQSIATALSESRDYSREYRIIRPDGAVRIIHAQAVLFYDERTGQAVKVTGTMHDITERQQVEASLRENEEKYRTLLESLADGVFVAQEYRFVFANPALPAMLGYTPEVFVGLPFEAVIAPEFLPLWTERFTQRLTQNIEPLKHYEVRLLCNGGEPSLWVELRANRIEYQGRPAVMGIIRDITRRKRTEAELSLSMERLSLALEAARAGTWEWDLKTNENIWSEELWQVYGLEPHSCEPSYETWQQTIHPADRAGAARVVQEAAANGLELNTEWRVLNPDGTERWLMSRGKPTRDTQNQVVRFNGIVLDITERKQAEQALLASEERYRHTLDAMLEGCQIIGFDWRYLYLNDIADQHNRRPKEELLGQKYMEMWPGIESTAVFKIIRQCMAQRRSQSLENEFTFPDGSQGWFELHINPVPEGVVIFSLDISERKRAEVELHRMMAELKRSNADLEQFAYAASHDLQEPLRGVTGMLTLLQQRYRGRLDERADEFIHHAVEGATRMQTLINDLLVLSRVGTRGKPFQPIASADALADALSNLSVAIRESEAAIRYDNLPTIVADQTQMTQLFQNLIGNAIKFRGDKTPEIQVKAERQAGEWVFAVADNGIGLEAKDFERIFGVFQRLHTRREYSGTGIGLALCKKIVERHGGRIWVESQPGQGATFYFTLPGEAGQIPVMPA